MLLLPIKPCFFLIVLPWTISCIPSSSLIGTHVFEYPPDFVEVRLESDNTFQYLIRSELCADKTLIGQWQQKGSKIYLSSAEDIQPEPTSPFKLSEQIVENQSFIRFRVMVDDSIPIFPVNIYLNDLEHPILTNEQGIATYANSETITRILLSSLAGRDVAYKVKNPRANDFLIKLYQENILPCDQRTFIPIWKWKKGKLYPHEHKR